MILCGVGCGVGWMLLVVQSVVVVVLCFLLRGTGFLCVARCWLVGWCWWYGV